MRFLLLLFTLFRLHGYETFTNPLARSTLGHREFGVYSAKNKVPPGIYEIRKVSQEELSYIGDDRIITIEQDQLSMDPEQASPSGLVLRTPQSQQPAPSSHTTFGGNSPVAEQGRAQQGDLTEVISVPAGDVTQDHLELRLEYQDPRNPQFRGISVPNVVSVPTAPANEQAQIQPQKAFTVNLAINAKNGLGSDTGNILDYVQRQLKIQEAIVPPVPNQKTYPTQALPQNSAGDYLVFNEGYGTENVQRPPPSNGYRASVVSDTSQPSQTFLQGQENLENYQVVNEGSASNPNSQGADSLDGYQVVNEGPVAHEVIIQGQDRIYYPQQIEGTASSKGGNYSPSSKAGYSDSRNGHPCTQCQNDILPPLKSSYMRYDKQAEEIFSFRKPHHAPMQRPVPCGLANARPSNQMKASGNDNFLQMIRKSQAMPNLSPARTYNSQLGRRI